MIDLAEKKETKAAAKEQRRQQMMEKMASKPGATSIGAQPRLGYKKGKGSFSNSYILECNHLIAMSGMRSSATGKVGKTVYCEVCKESRRIAASKRF